MIAAAAANPLYIGLIGDHLVILLYMRSSWYIGCSAKTDRLLPKVYHLVICIILMEWLFPSSFGVSAMARIRMCLLTLILFRQEELHIPRVHTTRCIGLNLAGSHGRVIKGNSIFYRDLGSTFEPCNNRVLSIAKTKFHVRQWLSDLLHKFWREPKCHSNLCTVTASPHHARLTAAVFT